MPGEKTSEDGSMIVSASAIDALAESQLDALEWAKDFMNGYEKRKNVISTEIESEKCGRYPKRETIPFEGSSVVAVPPKDSPESNPSFTN